MATADRTLTMIDISRPESVEIVYRRNTLWINVDGICRLRVGGAVPDTVFFDIDHPAVETKS